MLIKIAVEIENNEINDYMARQQLQDTIFRHLFINAINILAIQLFIN